MLMHHIPNHAMEGEGEVKLKAEAKYIGIEREPDEELKVEESVKERKERRR